MDARGNVGILNNCLGETELQPLRFTDLNL